MKFIFAFILSLFLSVGAFAQQDSLGFTNKAEAENKTVNGLKEGKWCEKLYPYEYTEMENLHHEKACFNYDSYYEFSHCNVVKDSIPPFYKLSIYKGGKPNGIVRKYYRDGKLHSIYYSKNGKIDGLVKWYTETGKLECEVTYRNDSIKDGVQRIEREGEIGYYTQLSHYKDGRKNGIRTIYVPEGDKEQEIPYVNDKISGMIKFFDDGKLYSEIPFMNGKIYGAAKQYYSRKRLANEDSCIDGKTKWLYKSYYKNGKLESEVPYMQDSLSASNTLYGYYGCADSNPPYTNTTLNGAVKKYFKNGKLQSETIYNNGAIVSTKTYDEKGNEIK